MTRRCLVRDVTCYWTVFKRSEGVIKCFKSKTSAQRWKEKHRPRGTRVLYVCIPTKER